MMRSGSLRSLAILLLVSGCAEEVDLCDPGEGENEAGECVPIGAMDAGRGDGGDVEAGTDGGDVDSGEPCGGGCEPAEFCVADACVECRTRDDCPDPAAAGCSAAGACEPCSSPDDCVRFGAPMDPPLTVCDVSLASPACVQCARDDQCGGATPSCGEGLCRACTPENQVMDCTGNACDRRTYACSPHTLRTQTLCEDCVSDDDCAPGSFCVETMWEPPSMMGAGRVAPAGTYCLPLAAGACTDPGLPDRVAGMSVGGLNPPNPGPFFCHPSELTTCAAARHAINQPSPRCTVDDDCGAMGLDDGSCVSGLPNRCTHRCRVGEDCFSNNCDLGPRICLPPM